MADLFLIVWWFGVPEDFLTWWFPVISTTLFSESLKCCGEVANWNVETTRRMIGSQYCETRCLCHHLCHFADCKLTCVFQVKDLWYSHSRKKQKLSLSLYIYIYLYIYICIYIYRDIYLYTLLGTNISPPNMVGKMIFVYHRWDMKTLSVFRWRKVSLSSFWEESSKQLAMG